MLAAHPSAHRVRKAEMNRTGANNGNEKVEQGPSIAHGWKLDSGNQFSLATLISYVCKKKIAPKSSLDGLASSKMFFFVHVVIIQVAIKLFCDINLLYF